MFHQPEKSRQNAQGGQEHTEAAYRGQEAQAKGPLMPRHHQTTESQGGGQGRQGYAFGGAGRQGNGPGGFLLAPPGQDDDPEFDPLPQDQGYKKDIGLVEGQVQQPHDIDGQAGAHHQGNQGQQGHFQAA